MGAQPGVVVAQPGAVEAQLGTLDVCWAVSVPDSQVLNPHKKVGSRSASKLKRNAGSGLNPRQSDADPQHCSPSY
jgi:hypothetical protein